MRHPPRASGAAIPSERGMGANWNLGGGGGAAAPTGRQAGGALRRWVGTSAGSRTRRHAATAAGPPQHGLGEAAVCPVLG